MSDPQTTTKPPFPDGEWSVKRIGSGRTALRKGTYHIADLCDHNMTDGQLKALEGILNYVGL